MEDEQATLEGESFGINHLTEINKIYYSDWIDTGNLEALNNSKEKISSKEYNLLNKEDEAIWIFENFVIKHHRDPKFIKDRIKRMNFIDKKLIPEVTNTGQTMFKYKKVAGDTLSKSKRVNDFINVLNLMQKKMWSKYSQPHSKFNEILDFFIGLKHKTV